jgi:regulatory protein
MNYDKNSIKTYTYDEALLRMMKYCAYQERCHLEVEQKLNEMRMIPIAKEKIILQLMQDNFLNEERFAKAFVRGKFLIKKWGRKKIEQHLQLKQISSFNKKTAFQEIDQEQYYKHLKEWAIKKSKQLGKLSYANQQKLYAFLYSKGYESELISEVINELKQG